MQAGIFSLIDDAHTSTAELLEDAVVRDGLSDQRARTLRGSNVQGDECRAVVRFETVLIFPQA